MAIVITGPFHVGDQALLEWTYTPKTTGVITAETTPTVEVYPPDNAPVVTYTTANGITEPTTAHYRLYIPISVSGTHKGRIYGTGATTGMEPFSFWAPQP